MKKVPLHARVEKDEYRAIRKSVDTTANLFGFEFHEVWDLMVTMIEQRHDKVMSGNAKSEMTLTLAAENIRKELAKERGRRDAIVVKGLAK